MYVLHTQVCLSINPPVGISFPLPELQPCCTEIIVLMNNMAQIPNPAAIETSGFT